MGKRKTIKGTKGDDHLNGTEGKDKIISGKGDDTINAGGGRDYVNAGKGDDVVNAGAGNDYVVAGKGDDTVTGGAGDDCIHLGKGNDTAIYVLGDNTDSEDFYHGGKGNDTLLLEFTKDEWLREDVQADIAAFLAYLNGEDVPDDYYHNRSTFEFKAFNLTAKQFENLEVVVDGKALNPADELVDAIDDEFEVAENNTIAGNVLDNDDVPDLVKKVELLTTVTKGILTFNSDGTFEYDTNGKFETLAVGETAIQTFTYKVIDADGDEDTATVTLTITGENDAPVLQYSLTEQVSEDSGAQSFDLIPLGSLTDVDASDTHSVVVASLQQTSGRPLSSAMLNGNNLQYDPNEFNDLAAGESEDLTFTFTITDNNGGEVTQTLDLKITGENDTPIITVTNPDPVLEGNFDRFNQTATDIQTVDVFAHTNIDDPDTSDTQNFVQGSISILADSTSATMDLGLLTIDQTTGKVSYDRNKFNFLDDHESAIYNVTYQVKSGPETFTETLVITILGENDAPFVRRPLLDPIDEDTPLIITKADLLSSTVEFDHNDQGNLALVDVELNGASDPYGSFVDNGDDTWTFTPSENFFTDQISSNFHIRVNFKVSDGTAAPVQSDAQFRILPVNDAPTVEDPLDKSAPEDGVTTTLDLLSGASDVENDTLIIANLTKPLPAGILLSGSILTIDPTDASFQHLAVGDSEIINLSYEIEDGNGASVPQTAKITITGTNDDPEVAAIIERATNEDDASFTIDLLEGATDVDDGETGTLSVTNVSPLPFGLMLNGNSITVDPSHTAFQHLAEGVDEVITVNYEIEDEQGGSVAQTAKITIAGKNDLPEVGAIIEKSANEDDDSFVVDLLDGASDPDDGETQTLSVANLTGLEAGLVQSGNTVTVDPSDAAFQSLAKDEPYIITLSYDIVDAQGGSTPQTAKITIIGKNDTPEIQSPVASSATEDDAPQTVDLLPTGAITDIDDGDVLSVVAGTLSQTGGRMLSSAQLSGNNLTYNPNEFNDLGGAESESLTFTYDVTDSKGGTVTQTLNLTINGENDAPVTTPIDAGQVSEDDAPFIINLLAGQTDPDTTDSLSIENIVAEDNFGNPVTLMNNNDGTITLDPNQYDALNDGENRIVTVTYDVADGTTTTQNTATLEVIGATDNLPPDAVDDVLSNEIKVAVIGTNSSSINDMVDQIDDDTYFGFSVKGYTVSSFIDEASWKAELEDYNVVVIGGSGFNFDGAATSSLWQPLLDFNSDGGGVVSTGWFHFTMGTVSSVDTRDLMDSITPINYNGYGFDAPPSYIDVNSVPHFVTNNISDFSVSPFWETSTSIDPGAISLGNALENGETAIAIKEADEFAGAQVYLGGLYLASNNNYNGLSTLRTGLPDQLLEQAIAWSSNRNAVLLEENTQFQIGVNDLLANDTDPDGDPLTITEVSQTSTNGATVTLNNDGTISYDPTSATTLQALGEGETTTDTFTYTITDGNGEFDTATVTVTILGQNDTPIAETDAYAFNEDNMLNVGASAGVLRNDRDVDTNDILTATLDQDVSNGTLIFNSDGSFKYTPNLNFNGEDSFTYILSDGTETTAPIEVKLTVNPVNDAPTVTGGQILVDEDQTHTITLADLGYSDVDGDELSSITINSGSISSFKLDNNSITAGQQITLAQINAGLFTFAPPLNFNGNGSISFTASDGLLTSTPASLAFEVTPVNDSPIADDDAFAIDADQVLTVAANGVLANDTDVDLGDILSVASHDLTSALGAAVTVNADGSLSYDATGVATVQALGQGAKLDDTFSYSLSDGNGGTDTATVTVTITGVNDAPEAVMETAMVDEDGPMLINVLDNDSDPNGDSLTIESLTDPTNGMAVIENGQIRYTPTGNFSGIDTFTYTIDDGRGGMDTATVTVNINEIADEPTLTAEVDGRIGQDLSAPLNIMAAVTDLDGSEKVTQIKVSGLPNGVVLLKNSEPVGMVSEIEPGVVFLDPTEENDRESDLVGLMIAGGGEGVIDFTLTIEATVTDKNPETEDTDTTTKSIMVDVNVNQKPVAENDEVTTTEDTAIFIDIADLLANDSDPDGDTVSLSFVDDNDSIGTAEIIDGQIRYTPTENFSGVDSFKYVINDGFAGSAIGTVTVNVTPVNDAPSNLTISGNNEVPENIPGALVGVLSVDDPDVGDTITYSLVPGQDRSLFTIVGDELRVGESGLDFEQSDTRTVTVRATDSIGEFVDQTITINVFDSQETELTPGDDLLAASADDTQVTGNVATLTSGDDLDGGDGFDSLALFGSGTFNLNNIAGFANFEEVRLVNATNGLSQLQLRQGTETEVVTSGSGRTEIFVSGTASLSGFEGGDGVDHVQFLSTFGTNISLDGGGNGDQLSLRQNGTTFDFTSVSLNGFESINMFHSNVTAIVTTAVLSDVSTVRGSSSSRLLTHDASLDLTGISVRDVTIQSDHATGTTFIVDRKDTAFQVLGGPGDDTLDATGLTFTALERESIFSATSIETIIDDEGTFAAPPPDPNAFLLTPGDDLLAASADDTQVTGNVATLTSGDDLDGGDGFDSLALFGSGTFNLNNIAGFANFEEVRLVNATNGLSQLQLRQGTETEVVTSGSGRTEIFVSGTASLSGFEGGDGVDHVQFLSTFGTNISLDGGGNGDQLSLRQNGTTFDFTSVSLNGFESINMFHSNVTAIVTTAVLSDVSTVRGSSSSRLLTHDASLDLTGISVRDVTIQSDHATGTTFIVDRKDTAFQVLGGPGDDTLDATGLTFTALERESIFSATSIETIIDDEGTFAAPPPDPNAFLLTPGDDVLVASADDTQVTGNVATLTSGDDLDGGDGFDSLALFGSGTFNLNNIAGFANFEEVRLVNATNGLSQLQLRQGIETEVVTSGSGRTEIFVSGTASLSGFEGGDGVDHVQFLSTFGTNISLDGGGNGDQLSLRQNGTTFDFTSVSLNGFESINMFHSNVTAIVTTAVLSDVSTVRGSSSSRLLTYDASLDLTGISVRDVTIQSDHATGTTFIVDRKDTAFQVLGGPGDDTLDATGLTFTALERESIFNTTAIETIIDDGGIYGNNDSNILQADSGGSSLFGGGGADQLIGDDGDDFIIGGSGDDLIIGGSGNDQLEGNADSDTFVFAPGSDQDLIIDFTAGENTDDLIDLTGFLTATANTVVADAMSQTAQDTVLDFGNGDSLTLEGVVGTTLHSDDFIIA